MELPVRFFGHPLRVFVYRLLGYTSLACLLVAWMLPFMAVAQVPPVVVPRGLDSVSPGAAQPKFRKPPPAVPPEQQDMFSVPPAVDRPLGVEEGPRVAVRTFDLKGVHERPRQNIHVKDVEDLLESIRLAHPDGFTIGELQEAANAVTDFYRKSGLIFAVAFIPVQTVEDGVVTVEVLEGYLGDVNTEGNKV